MATYFFANAGNDTTGDGSIGNPYKTIAKANALGWGGHTHYFKSGDTFNDARLDITGDGNTITTYNGLTPAVFTSKIDLPTGIWSDDGGNVWKTSALAAATGFTDIDYINFNGIYAGIDASTRILCKKAAKVDVTNPYNYYYDTTNRILYVYATSNPVTYYGGSVGYISNYTFLIRIDSKANNKISKIALQEFQSYGLFLTKTGGTAADNNEFSYNIVNGRVPTVSGTYLSYGVYLGSVNVTNSRVVNNVILNCNYGIRPNGTGIYNNNYIAGCLQYAFSRGSTGTFTADYNVCFGNGIYSANPGTADGGGATYAYTGTGGTWGAHNKYTDPGQINNQSYPGSISLTLDDYSDMYAGRNEWVYDAASPNDGIINEFISRNMKLSLGIVTGYMGAGSITDLSELLTFASANVDLTSHSSTHNRLTALDPFTLHYNGVATVTIAGNVISTTTDTPANDISWDLTNALYNTRVKLVDSFNAHASGKYTATKIVSTAYGDYTATINLSDIVAVDIGGATPAIQYDQTKLSTKEMTDSYNWFATNGYASPTVFIYPQSYMDITTLNICAGIYDGARGHNFMFDQYDRVASKGQDVQNVITVGMATLAAMTDAQITSVIADYCYRSRLQGIAIGLALHGEFTRSQMGVILDAINKYGRYLCLSDQIAEIRTGINIGDSLYAIAPTDINLNNRLYGAGTNNGDNTVWATLASITDLAGYLITNAAGAITAFMGTVDVGAYEWVGGGGLSPGLGLSGGQRPPWWHRRRR